MSPRNAQTVALPATARPSLLELATVAHPGTGFSIGIKRTKMVMRLVLFSGYRKRFLEIFDSPQLRQIPLANPRMYEKIFRHYLFSHASMGERLRLLQSNYRFIREFFDPSWVRMIYLHKNFTLWTTLLPDGSRISIRVAYLDRFEKEGELTLGLFNEAGIRLYSATFSLQMEGDTRGAVVGCLIGAGITDENKRLTKAMHGMRPQNFVFHALQLFLTNLGVTTFSAVAREAHIYSARARRKDRIKFDYDSFWEELGGTRSEDGKYFSLPLQSERREPHQIKTNKRAMYERRYALLDDLERQLREALEVPQSPPPRRTEGHLTVSPYPDGQGGYGSSSL